MKKNIFNLIIIIILFCILISLFIFSNDIFITCSFAFSIWKENIFPALFPMFIISDLLINYGFIDLLGEITKRIMNKLFCLPGESSFVIIASMFSGFPSSAKYIYELLDTKLITKENAEYLLTFTHFSNPLFVIGTIGGLLKSKKLALIILLVHILTNFIIAFVIKKKREINTSKICIKNALYKIEEKRKNNSFIKVLTTSITKTINTLLLLLGIITTFLILSKIINNLVHFSPINQAIISGILEMTQGIKYVSLLDISANLKSALMTFLISFGGISIHLQIKSILSNTTVNYKNYLFARIIHASLSSIIVFIITSIIKI